MKSLQKILKELNLPADSCSHVLGLIYWMDSFEFMFLQQYG